jgi:hypothetical protein
VLESSGGEKVTRRTLDLSKLEEMDDEQIGKAILGIGIV